MTMDVEALSPNADVRDGFAKALLMEQVMDESRRGVPRLDGVARYSSICAIGYLVRL